MDKNKGMMIIIIAMLGLIIAAIVVFAIIVLPGLMNNDGQAQAQEPPTWYTQQISEQDIIPFTLSRDITANLLSQGAERHIVRVTVGIGINNTDPDAAEDIIEMLQEREVVIEDAVNGILRRTTRDQLSMVGGMEILADEILITLQEMFGSQLIVRVYLGNLITS